METQLNQFHFEKDFVYELTNKVDKDYFIGGQKLRSMIIESIGEDFNLNIFQLAPYARVIELVHNATLLHDDVIDQSDYRRGVETMWSKLDAKSAILTGDYMLAKAMAELSSFAPKILIQELSKTLKDLVEGELLQASLKNKLDWNYEIYEKIAIKKTASVFRWCMLTPIYISNISHDKKESLINNIPSVANKLGLLYQMIDDVKDFISTSNKSKLIDLKNNNINYVLIELKNSSLICKSKSEEELLPIVLLRSIDRINIKLNSLYDDINFILGKNNFYKFIQQRIDKAYNSYKKDIANEYQIDF